MTYEELVNKSKRYRLNGDCDLFIWHYASEIFNLKYEEEVKLIDYLIDGISKNKKFDFLKSIYLILNNKQVESRFQDMAARGEIPESEKSNIINNITFEDDGKVDVFRGINIFNDPNGCSYTLSKEKAEWFAYRYGHFNGCFVKHKRVSIDDIIFFDNRRMEKEVLLKK